MCSCRLILHPLETVPWLRLNRSEWTLGRLPRTRLHPRHCDGGGGGGGEDGGQHPGPPPPPVVPFLHVATEVSCWLRPHLVREDKV